ncbi:MAG: prolyl oligopeptidase family serine peptidase, partial [Flavihumibacter sp.]
RICFLSYADGWPHLYSMDPAGGEPVLLTPGKFMAEHIRVSPDGKWLYFAANTGPDPLDIDRRHVCRVAVDKPGVEVLTPGDGLEWSPVPVGGELALISATAQRPPLPAVMPSAAKKWRLIGEKMIPASFPGTSLVTPKQVVFTAPDGMEVHAQLFEPKGGAARKPAVIYIHGGPMRQMLLGWHYSDYYANGYATNQYLASQGFVVLSVNYRLGIGYGYRFHFPAAAGPLGASEYQDIKAAGQWLQQQPFVDPAKIGVYGGSYGGYLTAMALAKDSKLFAAGVDIHGVHDWSVLGGLPEQNSGYEKIPDLDQAIETAFRSSPVAYVKSWTSPVLIIHADDDRNVPFNQSTDLVKRLEALKVPLQTKVIVGDTHHWMKYSHALELDQAVADFFMQTLSGK